MGNDFAGDSVRHPLSAKQIKKKDSSLSMGWWADGLMEDGGGSSPFIGRFP